jgi:hypothetical protein
MAELEPLERARMLPSGARFYRCALQVNPFEYLRQYHKEAPFANEATYNQEIIAACKQHDIEVIAITDHYCVRSSEGLRLAARQAGLIVFPGFEAVTKDGVHLLCLFDPDRTVEQLERLIGDCGIHDDDQESPLGDFDALELLERARSKWQGICIAAHVASEGGLLRTLKGKARIQAWKSSDLLACSLPGPVDDAPAELRPILQNRDQQHRRNHPITVINAQDVNSPGDLAQSSSSCWIKMSQVGVEGLRQAFLDPESRIRLATDPTPQGHIELAALAWEGGFLDGQGIHFNENLNVLIGGRGTGKSTILESIRYVLGLDPLGDEARRAHEGIVRGVLRSGTKISLSVCTHSPSRCEYRIERTVPNPPLVRNDAGDLLDVAPAEIVPRVEVYGQHEIAELTKSPEKLTRLLDRFAQHDPDLPPRKVELARKLEGSRTKIRDLRKEIQAVDDRLARLPGLEETLRRFQQAGLEERLQERSALVREERVVTSATERLGPLRELLDLLRRELPIDLTFLSPRALEDLPGEVILADLRPVFEQLSAEMQMASAKIEEALNAAVAGIARTRSRWEERQQAVLAAYERILRELQKAHVDGEEFIRLRKQVEDLRPLAERRKNLVRDLDELERHRRNLLAEWENLLATQFRELERAAKKVNRKLVGHVRVQVAFVGDREPLYALLREEIGGRLAEAIEALRRPETLSLKAFAEAWREGAAALTERYAIPRSAAERLAAAPVETVMRVEELELRTTTRIELNVATEGQEPVWRVLDDLSTGQKATAVLLLLLLESDAPLLIDQPEDDLDNRFVTEGVVPKMKEEKRRRQFIFSTHNANIPVLGDAELILGLRATGEAGQGYAEIPVEYMGSIDAKPVRDLVEELLEGGEAAFQMRRLKYGF